MTITIRYIDDEIKIANRDAQYIKSRLEIPDEFEIDLQLPPKRLSGLSDLQDALLVDMDLSTAEVEGETIAYFGSTLASEMRMHYADRPVILITQPNKITAYKQLLEDSIDVDLILYKDAVIQDPDNARRKIVALVEGFQSLAKISTKPWALVLQLMGADEEEAELLREAASPLKQGSWTIPQVSRWIRNVVMGFPGILYDDITAATRLGIDLASFQKPNVQNLFQRAAYDGIFSTYKKCWWRNQLFFEARKLILKHELDGPISEKFSEAFKLGFDEQLEPALCIYDQTPVAEWVCYIYNAPVKLQNSIPYYPDSRPDVMDQARVSFKAIDKSEEFDENLVDADSYDLVVKPRWGLE
ncbi:MAG: hypothetical protein GY797_34850 [Deltaproteobacteria bacterium]|nr:hypothetical protein [Deltaproteobacteria bacterium]